MVIMIMANLSKASISRAITRRTVSNTGNATISKITEVRGSLYFFITLRNLLILDGEVPSVAPILSACSFDLMLKRIKRSAMLDAIKYASGINLLNINKNIAIRALKSAVKLSSIFRLQLIMRLARPCLSSLAACKIAT